jgi:hypothetical protein
MLLVAYALLLGCGSDNAAPGTAKDITSFTVSGITGTIGANTVAITVPFGTDLSSLTPTIIHTGASVSPASGAPRNFTAPQTYTVTAADNSTKDYTVTVTVALPPSDFLNDGFEGGGWSYVTFSGSQPWSIVSAGSYPAVAPHSGTMMASYPSFSISNGSARIYRTSGFAIPGTVTSANLTFFMYHDAGYSASADQVQVQVSTDGGTVWTDIGSSILRYSATTNWAQHTLDLTAYKGQTVILGFLATSGYGNNMYLDDIQATGTY